VKKIMAITIIIVFWGLVSICAAANEGQDNFNKTIKRSFSSSIIKSREFNNGTGIIFFKVKDDYLGTGDKINKIFAITSARLFTRVPNLSILKIAIPLSKDTRVYKRGIYTMVITRQMIEQFYKMKFSKRLQDNNYKPWRQEFIQKYDSKRVRAIFAVIFVKYSKK